MGRTRSSPIMNMLRVAIWRLMLPTCARARSSALGIGDVTTVDSIQQVCLFGSNLTVPRIEDRIVCPSTCVPFPAMNSSTVAISTPGRMKSPSLIERCSSLFFSSGFIISSPFVCPLQTITTSDLFIDLVSKNVAVVNHPFFAHSRLQSLSFGLKPTIHQSTIWKRIRCVVRQLRSWHVLVLCIFGRRSFGSGIPFLLVL